MFPYPIDLDAIQIVIAKILKQDTNIQSNRIGNSCIQTKSIK